MKRARTLFSVVVLGILLYATVHVLPSRNIRIAAGPVGGSYYETALQYKTILEPKGYRVEIVPFQNTDEIGADVVDIRKHLDLGFVIEDRRDKGNGKLMSLGDIQLQPIFIFENHQTAAIRPIRSFSDLRGMTLVMPPEHSVTSRTLLSIFALSGVSTQNTRIEFLPLNEGIAGLKQGRFDAGLFILGADNELMADLAKSPNLDMVQVAQQKAIEKHLTYLKEVRLPAGIFDLGRDIPGHDMAMLAATISVVARRDLPPATAYAVLEAMRKVHRKSSYVNGTNEFPHYSADVDQADGLVDDFYRNGTPWTYSHFPIALASVIDSYLALMLALWFAMSAFNVISELEKLRFFVMVALARAALWWVRWRSGGGRRPSNLTRAVIGKLDASLAKEDGGVHHLLAELRQAVQTD